MDGFINIDKPAGFTSQDVVAALRKYFHGAKLGHGGTLDPAATGVLVLCVGFGTRLQELIMGEDKIYETDVIFGLDSPTLDLDGQVSETDPKFVLQEESLRTALTQFIGETEQTPPLVSAIKQGGVPLYKLARKGVEVDVKPRRVRIDNIELLSLETCQPFPRVRLRVHCGCGTYIRALARDFGVALGTTAVADHLRRIASGRFVIENAFALEDVRGRAEAGDYSFVQSIGEALTDLPSFTLRDWMDINAVQHGNTILHELPKGFVRLDDIAGRTLALAQSDGQGRVQPVCVNFEHRKKVSTIVTHKLGAKIDNPRGTAVALGNFDGVHCGHRLLIAMMMDEAERRGLASVVMTFSPHPRRLFKDASYKMLQTEADKIGHISDIGPDTLVLCPFDRELSALSPKQFTDRLLVDKLQAKLVCIGYNFRFGCQAAGDGDWLREYGKTHGFEVRILPELDYNGAPVSSTSIKQYLADGQPEAANRLLGYPYRLCGVVVEGKQLGRTIGFPTANIDLPDELFLPADGVYAGRAWFDETVHNAVCCIGTRPTIGDGLKRTVEVHFLDGNYDLYGRWLNAEFYVKLRDNMKFNGLPELKAQITRDARQAREYFSR